MFSAISFCSVFFFFFIVFFFFFFVFFQAEDGIRDRDVTGVQTCALPISNDVATADTCHARTKAVFVLSLALAWLIGSLHFISKFRPGKYV